MAVYKCSLLLQVGTINPQTGQPARIGGWSEIVYFNGSAAAADAALHSLAVSRAGLLPNQGKVVGRRVQQISPPGASQTFPEQLPGGAGLQNDIPQMGLLFAIRAANGLNVFRRILRGIPDARVVNGEYSPSIGFTQALISYWTDLFNFSTYGIDLTNPRVPVISVATTGAFVLQSPIVMTVGDNMRAYRMLDQYGRPITGLFPLTVGGSTTGTLGNWDNTLTSTRGQLRVEKRILVPLAGGTPEVERIVTRRVGRPFGQYVGRRSARR